MSSLTVTHRFVDGTEATFRRPKQGRKPLPKELRKVKFSARISPRTKNHVADEAKKYNMKPSAYADLALARFRMDDVRQQLVNT